MERKSVKIKSLSAYNGWALNTKERLYVWKEMRDRNTCLLYDSNPDCFKRCKMLGKIGAWLVWMYRYPWSRKTGVLYRLPGRSCNIFVIIVVDNPCHSLSKKAIAIVNWFTLNKSILKCIRVFVTWSSHVHQDHSLPYITIQIAMALAKSRPSQK